MIMNLTMIVLMALAGTVSPDPEITFNNIESRLNSKMSAITGEIQKTLMTVTDQIENRLSQFDTRIRSHENQSVNLGSGLGPQVNSGDRPHSLNDSHVTHNDHGDDSDRNINSYSGTDLFTIGLGETIQISK